MKILHIVLSRGFAGSERSTSESCNAQCQDHEVMLVVRADHRSREGISIVDHIDPRVRIVELSRWWFTRWRLARVIRSFAPDVIHCHLRRSTRYVAQINPPCATVSTLHIGVNGPHFARMGGLICNARWQLKDVPPGYTGLVHKANNSLVPNRQLTRREVADLRASLGVQPGEVLVGGVGRLSPVKGWDTLIAAVRQHPELTTLRLAIFGAGSAEAALKAQAAGDARISLPGYRKDVKDLYQAFDLFVCPSRFEPLPRVMLEAMDAGTPVIASDADGCRELVEDYGGALFPIGDVEQLGQRLVEHLAQPLQRTQIDLSAHHVQVANQANVDFYRRVMAAQAGQA